MYAQTSSTYYAQGTGLSLKLTEDYNLPLAALNIFDIAPVLVFVPLVERALLPYIEKNNIKFGVIKRMAIGFFLSTLSALMAFLLEIWRQTTIDEGDTIIQDIGDSNIVVANLSVLFQIPQFFFIGLSEVFAVVAGIEFVYDQAPQNLKSLLSAASILMLSLGSFFGTFVLWISGVISSYFNIEIIATNINNSRLDLYFIILVSLGTINLLLFVFVSRSYKFSYENVRKNTEFLK